MPSLLELNDLYTETLSRELIEKTKTCGLEWTSISATQFRATSVNEDVSPTVTWEFTITKTQIGNVTDNYTLDIKKGSTLYVSSESGALPKTGRESIVKELFEIVELIVMGLDSKLKETVSFVQGLTDCRS